MNAGAKLAWGVVLVAAILHFDFWAWDDDTLVFGFLPSALAYHAGLSIAAAIGWALVVRFDWPDAIEAWAKGGDGEDGPGESNGPERGA